MDLLHRRFAIDRLRLRPDARLLTDLGVDGDDAVEFFKEIQRRHGTDLTTLRQGWARYFGREGIAPGMLAACFATAVAALLFTHWLKLPLGAGLVLAVLLLGGLVALRGTSGPKADLDISVAEVVDAILMGRWPDVPPA